MKTTIKKRTWRAIYRLLDKVSPIDGDCGKLCGSACCTVNGQIAEEEMGIYLPIWEVYADFNGKMKKRSAKGACRYEK